MAHKKAGGSTKNGRDSKSKRLGVKKFGGNQVKPGSIIIKQRGTKIHAGQNVLCSKDYSLMSLINGIVFFYKKKNKKFVSVKKNY